MARYTIREFSDALGFKPDRDSITRAGIVIKALVAVGIAKEAGLKYGVNGRPSKIYEVQTPVIIPLK